MTGLDDKSLGEVQTQLETLKIPNKIDGTSVMVPAADADTARIQLAEAGLPQSGYIGYSSIKTSFGMTQDEFNIQVLDALQQSLNETIESINGVESAQVHIVMPQQQLFVSQPTDTAKASVFVQLGQGVQLSPVQVAGIQQLVAHSVSGLSTDDVSVVDQNGVTLSDQTDSNSGTVTAGTSSELALRENLESQLTQQLTNGLDQIVGQGNAVVEVSANVTFNQVETKSHTLQPASGQSVGYPTSQQTSRTTTTGGTTAGGVAGQSSSNPSTPTYAGQSGSGGGNSTSVTQSDQYAYNTVDTTNVADPMQINGIQVGVMLNAADKSLTPATISQIKSFVANAVGVQSGPNASNNITVSTVPFSTSYGVSATSGPNKLPLYGGIAAAVLAAAAGVWLLLRRRRRAGASANEALVVDEIEPLQPETPADRTMQTQVAKLAAQKPDEFANLLRTWLMSES